MNVFVIAEALGKFEHEILELSPEEYARWLAYFRIQQKEIERNRRRK